MRNHPAASPNPQNVETEWFSALWNNWPIDLTNIYIYELVALKFRPVSHILSESCFQLQKRIMLQFNVVPLCLHKFVIIQMTLETRTIGVAEIVDRSSTLPRRNEMCIKRRPVPSQMEGGRIKTT